MKKLLLVLASLAMIIGLCACGGGGGLFAKHHALEENLEVFHHRADVRVDLQAQDLHLLLRNQVQAVTVMLRQCFTEVSL